MATRPFSGPATHVRGVCDELKRLGHQVRIVARFDRQVLYSDDGRTFQPDAGFRGSGLQGLVPFDSLGFAFACRRLLRGFDLFYERMGWLGFGGSMASAWLRVPLIMEVNGDHVWERGMYGQATGGMALAAYTAATGLALRRAGHVVASGTAWRSRAIERFRLEAERVSVVHNGTCLVDLLSREDLRCFAAAAGDGPVRIAYVGGFYPWHGVGVLLRASRRLVDLGCPVELALMGSGPGLPDARGLAAQLGLGKRVAFTGPLPPGEYGPKLAASDIGAAPYCGTVEFTGLKLMDYKAAGLAIVASGRDGRPEVIRDGVTGIIVGPGDEDALVQALLRLAQDRDLRRALGRCARMEAEQLHSWRHTAAAIEAIMKRVLAAARPP